ncbi:MAG: hypothetical protein LBJ72_06200 [Dysgonamonadaceae bacterium]|jgi:hypothetical protein|nr:hypothetical protein [Dysgonamonadaceae bacterium]
MKAKIFLIALCFTITGAMFAQETKDKWDFPVKPGTEEWRKLKSYEARVKACQVPEEILLSLSTNELTDICLEYPLLYDIFAFNNRNKGINKFFDNFNGIRELYKRKDAANELLNRYDLKLQQISFVEGNASDYEKGGYTISISILEMLLCFTDTQGDIQKKILQKLVSGYENKLLYTDYFKGLGLQCNFYSRAHIVTKILQQNNEQSPIKDGSLVLTSGRTNSETVDILNKLSYQLIKE